MELQIAYLRSRRDDERAREACTTYLETWLADFYPDRPDIVERARRLAGTWGAELRMPRVSWKYRWIGILFGERAAKDVQRRYNLAKSAALGLVDRALLSAQGGVVDVARL
jgi:hypothetical protein